MVPTGTLPACSPYWTRYKITVVLLVSGAWCKYFFWHNMDCMHACRSGLSLVHFHTCRRLGTTTKHGCHTPHECGLSAACITKEPLLTKNLKSSTRSSNNMPESAAKPITTVFCAALTTTTDEPRLWEVVPTCYKQPVKIAACRNFLLLKSRETKELSPEGIRDKHTHSEGSGFRHCTGALNETHIKQNHDLLRCFK